MSQVIEMKTRDQRYLTRDVERALGRAVRAGLAEGATEAEVRAGRSAEAEMAEAFWPLVRKIAGTTSYRVGADAEDCMSIALEALVDVIRRFDPDRGYRFSTFASRRLTGAILDHASRESQLVKTTRETRRIHRCEATGEAMPHYLRERAESHEAGWRQSQHHKALHPIRLDRSDDPTNFHMFSGRGASMGDVITDPALWAREPKDHLLAAEIETALNGLDRTWRQAIVLYFGLEGEPINQKSIGRELGLSESRICQILKAACEQLRENLSRHVHLQEAV